MQVRAEHQKLKAKKQAVPASDDEDDELSERPNTMVYIHLHYLKC